MFVESERNERGKRKRRSFFQRQKRLAKRGSFGRGTQLTEDMHEYFMNIMKVLQSKKEDEEEMRVLSSNVLEEIEGKESEYCCNEIVSRIVECLLPLLTDEELEKFTENFGEKLRPIFSDPFGSHVLEQSVVVSYQKHQCQRERAEELKESEKKFLRYILKVGNFFVNNLEEFIWNVYSNAIGRTILNVANGKPVKGEVKASQWTKEEMREQVEDEELTEMLRKFGRRVLSFPQLNDLWNSDINSGFLQSLVLGLVGRDLPEGSELCAKMKEFYEGNRLDLTEVENAGFVRLLEVLLTASKKSDLKKIYKWALKERLTEIAKSRRGNLAVEKLIGNCRSKKLFGEIFVILESEMENVLEAGNSGVLLALVKGCRDLEMCQGQCMKMLEKVFHMRGSEDIVPAVSTLTRADLLDLKRDDFNVHGCVIVEEIMHFGKPGNVAGSLLSMTESNLVKLLSDTKGCHIADAFVGSSYVGEKNREKLLKKLRGHYLSLATSKHGSRSLDAIWSTASIGQKGSIAEELKSRQSELCANVFGWNFARKIHLDNYRRNKEEWMRVYKSSEAAEKYLADIIPSKRKKKGSS